MVNAVWAARQINKERGRNMAEKIRLSGVPETMLQTVYARAKESGGRGAVQDKTAEELIRQLDYDFSLADRDAAMHNGVIARTIVLDRLTGAWLAENPDAVVVNNACGLDTRCYRMSEYGRTAGRWRSPPTAAQRLLLSPHRLPLAKHAKAYGYEALLPHLCQTDHLIAEVMHMRLIRTQIKALGGSCCDYWFVDDKSPVLDRLRD